MKNLHHIPINIADMLIKLNSPLSSNELGIKETFRGYFGVPEKPESSVVLNWESSNRITVPEGEVIYNPGSFFKVYHAGNDYYIELNHEIGDQKEPTSAMLRANSAWDDLTLTEICAGTGWQSLLNSFAGELISRTIIIFTNGLFFHSSCLDDNGRGILYIGHSGAGKSTQLELWKQEPGVIAINDDRVAVRVKESDPICYGIPWCGSTAITCNHRVPLKAVIFLEQASHNSIEQVPQKTAAPLITACAFLPFWDSSLMIKAMATLHTLIERVPVYRLYCRPEKAVIPLVRSVL